MEKKGKQKLAVEDCLKLSLELLASQVARDLQKASAQQGPLAAGKREAYGRRVERLVPRLIESVMDDRVGLDGLMILSESFAKALCILAEDLGDENLGEVRSALLVDCMNRTARDINQGLQTLSPKSTALN